MNIQIQSGPKDRKIVCLNAYSHRQPPRLLDETRVS